MSKGDAKQLYARLAAEHEQRSRLQERDRFLVLAADAAQSAGQADEAERLRQELLSKNPHHLLKPYKTFTDALRSPDIMTYIQQLRRNYSVEKAEKLLHGIRGEPTGEGDDFSLPMNTQMGTALEKKAAGEPPIGFQQGAKPPPTSPRRNAPTSENVVATSESGDVFGFKGSAKRAAKATPIPTADIAADNPFGDEAEVDLPTTSGAWVGDILVTLTTIAAILGFAATIILPFVKQT
jgi:hypothetical protein